jgi:hypothetical protein
MNKVEERALKLIIPKQVDDIEELCRFFYIKGYHQAEKDLLENKHEKSWRLDEKLWKDIKDIEEASYQYVYDASNDWFYDIPTWEDVQDAFKAGSEWKENLALTEKDIANIKDIIADVTIEHLKTNKWSITNTFNQEVLNRFNKLKGR